MTIFARTLVVASTLTLLTLPGHSQTASNSVSGTNPKPQSVSGTNPKPQSVSGTNPKPQSVSGTNPKPSGVIGTILTTLGY